MAPGFRAGAPAAGSERVEKDPHRLPTPLALLVGHRGVRGGATSLNAGVDPEPQDERSGALTGQAWQEVLRPVTSRARGVSVRCLGKEEDGDRRGG